jgi:hypothetical protein
VQNVSSCRRTGPIDGQRCSFRFGTTTDVRVKLFDHFVGQRQRRPVAPPPAPANASQSPDVSRGVRRSVWEKAGLEVGAE